MQNQSSASCACEDYPKTKGRASREDVPELRHYGVIEAPRRGGRAPGRQGRQSPCACQWRLKPERREWPDLPRSQRTGVASGGRRPVKELKMGGELGGREPVSDLQRKSAAKVDRIRPLIYIPRSGRCLFLSLARLPRHRSQFSRSLCKDVVQPGQYTLKIFPHADPVVFARLHHRCQCCHVAQKRSNPAVVERLLPSSGTTPQAS